MSYFNSDGPNRYLCSVLDEMRTQLKLLDKKNIKQYISLTGMMIEEVQTLGNRMEAALEDISDIEGLLKRRSKLKKEIRVLREEKALLTPDGGDDD